MARSKAKSITQQLIDAQQRRAKEKAAREKAEREVEQKERRAAARRAEAEARRVQRAAEAEARRKQAADARQVEQVLRGMEKRETARQQAEAREALLRQREALRAAEGEAARRLRAEAAERTAEVEGRVRAIGSILAGRDRGLEALREETDGAYESDGAEGFAECVAAILAERAFLKRGRPVQVVYSPANRRLTLEVDLPRREGIPAEKCYRYVAAREEVVAEPRKESEVRSIYQDAVARLILCVADYVAAITSAALVDAVAVNGFARTTDPATGHAVRPCLVSLLTSREAFAHVALDEPGLDPVRCLQRLGARVSPSAYDHDAVLPIVELDLERLGAAGDTRDAQLDLTTMDPFAFERLIRDLFLAMGFKAWRTPDSHDGGVDAVAVRDDLAIGGVCVIQAKRYNHTVPVEAVRALFGSMQAQKASTGVVVTTSSFGPASHAFADEVGRITLIDGPRLRVLLEEHLGMAVRISAEPPRTR
ncbi:restriction endonuclease [Catenulispora subtropica]|uniref:Restriction endonuclease type IV Mrr domain-containing protein n=1 Tax=Catenulispora subtropica TaxID=450798 RepID=A0ABN2T1L1_9ACTN